MKPSKIHGDDAAGVVKDKEELEVLSADLLTRLSVRVLRKADFPPMEVVLALDPKPIRNVC